MLPITFGPLLTERQTAVAGAKLHKSVEPALWTAHIRPPIAELIPVERGPSATVLGQEMLGSYGQCARVIDNVRRHSGIIVHFSYVDAIAPQLMASIDSSARLGRWQTLGDRAAAAERPSAARGTSIIG
ncbi:hypothetical protein GCM10023196_097720 [Actinoallomurus vinaceus]|uniref:Uncharacterized protein n=1 Tax=Actinoallomurus vinaceus TaxID=1080074 RepID=A0ABP8USJ8_9ACTN